MAFNLDCRLLGYEVRDVSSGVSKKGTAFRSIVVESPEGAKRNELSCSDSDLFPAIDSLKLGNIINIDVAAVAGRERSFVIVTGAPTLVLDSAPVEY